MQDEGNVVIGYTSHWTLMLDRDLQRKDYVIDSTKKYTKFHKLGSALIMQTSDNGQMDLDLNHLKSFSVIFGKPLSWEEIRWHVKEAYRLGMVDKNFLNVREYDHIAIRVNAKNDEKPHPKIVYYFSYGDRRGVMGFLNHWVMCRNLGSYAHAVLL